MKLNIGGKTIDYNGPEDPDQQLALQELKATGQRATCLCKGAINDAPELYIARVAGKFIPKRMPGSYKHHAPECDLYDRPVISRAEGSIDEDPSTGRFKLKRGFSLSKKLEEKPEDEDPLTPTSTPRVDDGITRPPSMTLKRLIRFCFNEANFDQWHPRMRKPDGTEKRTWGVVGYYLKAVFDLIDIGREPIGERVLIPSHKHDENNKIAADNLLLALKKSNRGKTKALGIVMDEVKSITKHQPKDESKPECLKIGLKHLPFHSIFGPGSDFASLRKAFDRSRSEIDDSRVRTFILATVYTHSGGTMSLGDYALLSTNAQYIPFNNLDEFVIAEKAIEQQRRFLRPADFTTDGKPPALTLLDTEIPTDLYLGDGPETPPDDLKVITHFDPREPFPEKSPAVKADVVHGHEPAAA